MAKSVLEGRALKKKINMLKPFRAGLDILGIHVVITDEDAHILYANKTAQQNTGYSLDEMLGRNPAALWGGHMSKSYFKEMWRVIKLEKKPFRGQIKNILKDGTESWQEIHITPVVNPDNEVLFYIAVEIDITKQKKYLEELEEKENKLSKVVKNMIETDELQDQATTEEA